ncbi:MAG: AraC family transcriptional regulator [Lachnospiraceae bacterium]|nr:AraC family transcriptional regulator [Lachnospiraceae bacterium]
MHSDQKKRILYNMNFSSSSDVMRVTVSWCKIRFSEDEKLSTGRHMHTLHELHYIYEGELSFEFDNESLLCPQGSYAFIPPNISHKIAEVADRTKKLVIGFDVRSDNPIISAVFDNTSSPLICRETDAFHALAEAIICKFSSENILTSVSAAYLVHALLLEVVDSLSVENKHKAKIMRDSEDAYRIDLMLSFINENIFNNITIVDIADALHLSVRQTSRVCQHLFGCTINQLLTQVRLKEICHMLADSQYSIAEIAEISGFASPGSFSRHFSRYAGVTPSSYRRNYELQKLKNK